MITASTSLNPLVLLITNILYTIDPSITDATKIVRNPENCSNHKNMWQYWSSEKPYHGSRSKSPVCIILCAPLICDGNGLNESFSISWRAFLIPQCSLIQPALVTRASRNFHELGHRGVQFTKILLITSIIRASRSFRNADIPALKSQTALCR